MQPEKTKPPGSLSGGPARLHAHGTRHLRDDASTSGGPTWYLSARPLASCHGEDEYAIDCPDDCGREALAWRSRPGVRAGGWACACGANGFLWQLLERSRRRDVHGVAA